MLELTNIKLELMSDIDMYQFIEKGIRDGIRCIVHRHGQANNTFIENYDKSAPSKNITYLDVNNLYGWAMSQYLTSSGAQTNRSVN